MGKTLSKTHSPTQCISNIFQFPDKLPLEQGTTICSTFPHSFLHHYRVEGQLQFEEFMNELIKRRKYIYDCPQIREYLPKISVIYVQKKQTSLCTCNPIYFVYITESYQETLTFSQYLEKHQLSYVFILQILKIIICVMAQYQRKRIKCLRWTLDEIFISSNEEDIKCIIRDPYVRSWKNINAQQKRDGDYYKTDVYFLASILQQILKKREEQIKIQLKYGQITSMKQSEEEKECQSQFRQILKFMLKKSVQTRYNWLQLERMIQKKRKKENKRIQKFIETPTKGIKQCHTHQTDSDSPQNLVKPKKIPSKTLILNKNQTKPSLSFPIDYLNLYSIQRCWKSFEGFILNGVKEGSGRITLSNNHTFDGVFKNDLADGLGVVKNEFGEVLLLGNWEHNLLKTKF